MDNQNRKLELLGNAPIPKALLAMGIPTMIGMLINALYNLVDAYFVGGLGESQMAAISVVYPLGQVVVGLGLLFGNGAASYISRLLGQRNKDQANKVASTALYSSLVVGAIMIVLSILFLKPILRLLGATESVLPYAATYASIYIVSDFLDLRYRLLPYIYSHTALVETAGGVTVVPSCLDLSAAEAELINEPGRELILNGLIGKLLENRKFDYILMKTRGLILL